METKPLTVPEKLAVGVNRSSNNSTFKRTRRLDFDTRLPSRKALRRLQILANIGSICGKSYFREDRFSSLRGKFTRRVIAGFSQDRRLNCSQQMIERARPYNNDDPNCNFGGTILCILP